MVAVYRVVPDFKSFARVILRDAVGFRERFPEAFNGRAMNMSGQPIRCTVDDRSKLLADFSGFLPGTFVVLASAAQRRMHYELAGQLIALIIDDRPAYAVNITQVVNAIDREHSDPVEDRFAFHPFRLSRTSLFKIPETASSDVLTHSGVFDEDDDFITYCRRESLSGLIFEQVWVGEG